jgi:hypothetical protein
MSKDASIKIFDNRKEVELHHSTIHFKTGTQQNNQKKKLNDLQSRILPSVSKEYLKNAQCNECLSDLESIYTDLNKTYLD